AAAGLAERHRAPAARARRRHARARLDRRRRGAVDRPRALARARAVTAVLLALFGGIALLLYGIRLSGDSLQRAAGGRLRHLLTGMARRRLIAVASGAAVTAIIQSSAATTLMLIGFVIAGLMAVLVAAVFSALVASSAATLGVAIALASHGLIGLSGAVAIVFGANIGTCATALTASVGATAEAKRVAVAHIAFKVLGAALMLPFVGPFTAMVAASAADPARQIANAHTFFNLGISLVFLPFTPLAARTIEAIV